MSRSRDIAKFLGATETNNATNVRLLTSDETVGLDSAQVQDVGLQKFTTLDSLPTTGLVSGQQAWVESSGRMYITNGSGWYNVALINSAPYWDSEPLSSYDISDSATALLITAKALDSDNPSALITDQSTASDSAQYLVTITRDSSVFTFTPKSQDSVVSSVTAGDLTDSSTNDFTYTFKWSDGISFVSKAVTINYNFFKNLDPFRDASLLALYELDGNGNDALGNYDATGYRAGSATGFSTSVKRYGSGSLQGNSTTLDLPDVKTTYPLTVSAWIRPTDWQDTSNNVVVNALVASQRISFTFYNWNSYANMFPMMMFGGGDHITYRNYSGITFTDEEWYHVIWCASASETGYAFINGVKNGTTTNHGGTHGGSAGWALGGNYAGGEHFEGHIDRVRVFNKVLSDSEALELYNGGG